MAPNAPCRGGRRLAVALTAPARPLSSATEKPMVSRPVRSAGLCTVQRTVCVDVREGRRSVGRLEPEISGLERLSDVFELVAEWRKLVAVEG
jgi:hypothetical protein